MFAFCKCRFTIWQLYFIVFQPFFNYWKCFVILVLLVVNSNSTVTCPKTQANIMLHFLHLKAPKNTQKDNWWYTQHQMSMTGITCVVAHRDSNWNVITRWRSYTVSVWFLSCMPSYCRFSSVIESLGSQKLCLVCRCVTQPSALRWQYCQTDVTSALRSSATHTI